MAVGRPPFEGDSPIEVVRKHLRDKPVPPRRVAAGLSRRFETVVLRALEKDPAKRFRNAAALRDALRPGAREVLPLPRAAMPAFGARRSSPSPFRRAVASLLTTVAILMTLTGIAVA